MSEQAFWRSIEKVLKALRDELFQRTGCDDELHWQRFEDKFGHGIPDVNVCRQGHEIWIELKQLDRWPVRPSTPVRLDLRRDQALWLKRRIKSGGKALVMAKVGREIYIFNRHFDDLVEGVPRSTFQENALFTAKTIREAIDFMTYYSEVTK